MLTFPDTGEEFKLQGDLLKMITNRGYNVDLAKLSDKKYCMSSQKKCILMSKLKVINLLEIERLQKYSNRQVSWSLLPVFQL